MWRLSREQRHVHKYFNYLHAEFRMLRTSGPDAKRLGTRLNLNGAQVKHKIMCHARNSPRYKTSFATRNKRWGETSADTGFPSRRGVASTEMLMSCGMEEAVRSELGRWISNPANARRGGRWILFMAVFMGLDYWGFGWYMRKNFWNLIQIVKY